MQIEGNKSKAAAGEDLLDQPHRVEDQPHRVGPVEHAASDRIYQVLALKQFESCEYYAVEFLTIDDCCSL